MAYDFFGDLMGRLQPPPWLAGLFGGGGTGQESLTPGQRDVLGQIVGGQRSLDDPSIDPGTRAAIAGHQVWGGPGQTLSFEEQYGMMGDLNRWLNAGAFGDYTEEARQEILAAQQDPSRLRTVYSDLSNRRVAEDVKPEIGAGNTYAAGQDYGAFNDIAMAALFGPGFTGAEGQTPGGLFGRADDVFNWIGEDQAAIDAARRQAEIDRPEKLKELAGVLFEGSQQYGSRIGELGAVLDDPNKMRNVPDLASQLVAVEEMLGQQLAQAREGAAKTVASSGLQSAGKVDTGLRQMATDVQAAKGKHFAGMLENVKREKLALEEGKRGWDLAGVESKNALNAYYDALVRGDIGTSIGAHTAMLGPLAQQLAGTTVAGNLAAQNFGVGQAMDAARTNTALTQYGLTQPSGLFGNVQTGAGLNLDQAAIENQNAMFWPQVLGPWMQSLVGSGTQLATGWLSR